MMTRTYVLILAALVALLGSSPAPAPAEPSERATVILEQPIPLEQALTLVRESGARPWLLVSRLPVAGVTVTDFFPVRARWSPARTSNRYRVARLDFLETFADRLTEPLAGEPADRYRERLAWADLLVEEVARYDLDHEIVIDTVIVTGTRDQLDRLRRPGLTVETPPAGRSRTEARAGRESATDWLPADGYTDVRDHPNLSGRYALNLVWWQQTSGFDSRSTYEHDLFLNNYDGRTYLDVAERGLGLPDVLYAASNFPRAYLDTRFGDPDGELAYTIGSAMASEIRADIMYWTYMRTRDGRAGSDGLKLTAQLGHRSPSWCYSTWCSYRDRQDKLIPAWHSVPATYYWWR